MMRYSRSGPRYTSEIVLGGYSYRERYVWEWRRWDDTIVGSGKKKRTTGVWAAHRRDRAGRWCERDHPFRRDSRWWWEGRRDSRRTRRSCVVEQKLWGAGA